MSNSSSSRRDFCKKSLLVLTALPVLGRTFGAGSVAAQGAPTKAVDPAGTQAAALGYIHDATKVDTAKYPKRAGAEGAKQFCDNCLFYQQGGLKAEGLEGEAGKCVIFPAGLVAAKGWCNSWSPKPA
jgi:hypothetical protein